MKYDVYPIKICVKGRNSEKPEELTSIMTIIPEAVEDTFNKEDTPPTINIKLLIDSNNQDDIDYLHRLFWFDKFIAYTGIFNLVNKVNFACAIEVNNAVEFTDVQKDDLNHIFEHFVEAFKLFVEDTKEHAIIWPDQPAFSITTPDPIKEEKPVEEPTPEATPVVEPEVVNEPVTETE